MTSYGTSLLIYFATPLVAAGVRKKADVSSLEKQMFREALLLPPDIPGQLILNIAMNGEPAWEVIERLSKRVRNANLR